MRALKQYFKANALFWCGMLLTILIMGLFLFENGLINGFLMLNSHHTPFWDTFFYYFTYIGGGLPCYVGIAVMIFWFRKGLFILAGQGIAAIITQPLKYSFARPRPLSFFTDALDPSSADLGPLIDSVSQFYSIPGGYNSFPSGHTSAIFAFVGCLAAILPNKYKGWQVAFLIIGIVGAYSRIYLCCHFVEDTLSGAFVGSVAVAIAYTIFYYKDWGEFPLYKIGSRVRGQGSSI